MSWASRRVCTRVEDTAYCMLGLFNVNMPLLYGEERKAFTRLQEEIIRATDDHSIFAWTIPKSVVDKAWTQLSRWNAVWTPHPILAPSPHYFVACGNVFVTGREYGEPSILTKHGLRIELCLKREDFLPHSVNSFYDNSKTLLAPLNCCLRSGSELVPLSLPLLEIDSSNVRGMMQTHYYRIGTVQHILRPALSRDQAIEDEPETATVYVRQTVPDSDRKALKEIMIIRFKNAQLYSTESNLKTLAGINSGDICGCPGLNIRFADHRTRDAWSTEFDCLPLSTNFRSLFALSYNEWFVLLLAFGNLGRVYRGNSVGDSVRPSLQVEAILCKAKQPAAPGWEWYRQEAEKSPETTCKLDNIYPYSFPKFNIGERILYVRIERAVDGSNAPRVLRHVFTLSFECEEA